ncbi:unnamed protein product [Effrenium voratum]|nr:unnamed protein product [Effrenium voratum]
MAEALGPEGVAREIHFDKGWPYRVQEIVSDRPEDFTVYDKDGFAIPLFAKDFDPSPEMFPLFICGRAAVGAAMAERALVTHSDLQMQGLQEPSQEAPLGRAREMQHDAAAIQEKFEVHEKLGEGTYGTVYKAKCRATGKQVAVKRIKVLQEDDGIPICAVREISLLKGLDHPNVVKLLDVFSSTLVLYLIFECMQMDLRMFLKKCGQMEGNQLRQAIAQCFSGLEFCHQRLVIHRDLKPQNVLLEMRGGEMRLVLADFGLARAFNLPLKVYTHDVVTLWYRPPETLLGQEQYGPSTDIWSVTCIFAEMATGVPLFPGDSEIGQIFAIFRVAGTPTEEVWPGVSALRDFKLSFPKWRSTDFAEVYARAGYRFGREAMELLRSGLRFNPSDRPSARRMLRMAYFRED